jgi:hypothetical protein
MSRAPPVSTDSAIETPRVDPTASAVRRSLDAPFLSMDGPNPRTVHAPDRGKVVEAAELGDMHHHYERLAA